MASDIRIERLEFNRITEKSYYYGKSCGECANLAEFEYVIWYNDNPESVDPESGALCGACAAVIFLQEASNPRIVLEKQGSVVRAVR